uniref:Secreted protein n=1 Tax=Anopheles farauti TaxID=69004 RepID=A0A182QPV4_9DIPT
MAHTGRDCVFHPLVCVLEVLAASTRLQPLTGSGDDSLDAKNHAATKRNVPFRLRKVPAEGRADDEADAVVGVVTGCVGDVDGRGLQAVIAQPGKVLRPLPHAEAIHLVNGFPAVQRRLLRRVSFAPLELGMLCFVPVFCLPPGAGTNQQHRIESERNACERSKLIVPGGSTVHVLHHERVQIVERPVAVVLRHLLAVAVEEDGRVAVHLLLAAQLLVRVDRAVHLRDRHVPPAGDLLRQLLPGRGEPHAVAAPGRVELHHRHAVRDRAGKVAVGQLHHHRPVVVPVGASLERCARRFRAVRCRSLPLLLLLLQSAGHFGDVLLEVGVRARPGVLFDLLAVLDPEQRRVALHLEVGADRAVLRAVDFGHADVPLVLEAAGQLLPGRGQLRAVTAPRCVELDEVLAGRDLGERGGGGRWRRDAVGILLPLRLVHLRRPTAGQLLVQERIELGEIAPPAIFHAGRRTLAEQLQHRVAGDVVLRAEIAIGRAVDAPDRHQTVRRPVSHLRQRSPRRGELLALSFVRWTLVVSEWPLTVATSTASTNTAPMPAILLQLDAAAIGLGSRAEAAASLITGRFLGLYLSHTTANTASQNAPLGF